MRNTHPRLKHMNEIRLGLNVRKRWKLSVGAYHRRRVLITKDCGSVQAVRFDFREQSHRQKMLFIRVSNTLSVMTTARITNGMIVAIMRAFAALMRGPITFTVKRKRHCPSPTVKIMATRRSALVS